MRDNDLFSEYMIHSIIAFHEDKLRKDIDGLDSKRLLGTSIDDWAAYYEAELRLTPPRLREDEIQADQEEVEVDVSHDRRRVFLTSGPHYVKGARFKFFVPFEGDAGMFKMQPSTHTLNPPSAKVVGSELVFSYERTDTSTSEVKRDFDNALAQVKSHLATLEKDVANYNSSIQGNAKAYLTARKGKLLANEQALNSLGFPLRRREGAPKTYIAPEVKRKPPVASPSRSAGSVAEPALELKEYENILSIISNMTAVMERSPHAFKEMGEEDLRQHFLVQLNGQYEGQATGETFNYEGKTDILIRSNGRNVFIAECKFWKGPSSFIKALDQLLGYAAWRDTKLALIIFNKNKELSLVLQQIPGLLQEHPNFIRMTASPSETSFRCVMHLNDDKQREATVTVLTFDVPS